MLQDVQLVKQYLTSALTNHMRLKHPTEPAQATNRLWITEQFFGTSNDISAHCIFSGDVVTRLQ